MENILGSFAGAFDIFSIAIDVALVMALFPTIQSFISGASGNMTGAEVVLAGLIPGQYPRIFSGQKTTSADFGFGLCCGTPNRTYQRVGEAPFFVGSDSNPRSFGF